MKFGAHSVWPLLVGPKARGRRLIGMTKRVSVVMGGWSAERPVSLVSGRGAAKAARDAGYEVTEIDATRDLASQLKDARPDVIFNALHGPFGEDGRVQGLFEVMGVPYTHSGVLASALAMDKHKSRKVFADAGLSVADGGLFDRHAVARDHVMARPYVVKPNADGSSFGVFIVPEGANRPPAEVGSPDWAWGQDVLVEAFIPGRELTVAVLGDRALAVTEIIPLREFYDFDAKYAAGGSRHAVPAHLPPEVEAKALADALTAHRVLGCKGLTRSDFRYDEAAERLVILETNTQPGLTPTSLAPEQAAYCGMDYVALVRWMIEDASCPR
jgi:D-alanine-D-alanine ligase